MESSQRYQYSGFTPKPFLFKGRGNEKNQYDQTKGQTVKNSITNYTSYLNDRIVNSSDNKAPSGVGSLFTKYSRTAFLADFFIQQENATKTPLQFIKSKDVSTASRVFTFLLGNTISGIAETLYHTVALIKNVVEFLFDMTLGMSWEAAKGFYDLILGENTSEFRERFSAIKNDASKAMTNLHQIFRNVVKIAPIIGHPVTAIIDRTEMAGTDIIERIADKAKNTWNAYFSKTQEVQDSELRSCSVDVDDDSF